MNEQPLFQSHLVRPVSSLPLSVPLHCTGVPIVLIPSDHTTANLNWAVRYTPLAHVRMYDSKMIARMYRLASYIFSRACMHPTPKPTVRAPTTRPRAPPSGRVVGRRHGADSREPTPRRHFRQEAGGRAGGPSPGSCRRGGLVPDWRNL